MPLNVITGKTIGFGIVSQDVLLNDIPELTGDSILIIKEYAGALTKTWKKGRPINGLQKITSSSRLLIVAKQNIDMSGYLKTGNSADEHLTNNDGEELTDNEGNLLTE